MSPYSAPKLPSFWAPLSKYGITGTARTVWSGLPNALFALVEPFLINLVVPTPAFVPCPLCPRPRRLSTLQDGTLVMEKPDTCGICEPIRGIAREQVQPLALDPARLATAAARVLDFTPDPSPQRSVFLLMGTIMIGTRVSPVVLVFAPDPAAAQHAATLAAIPPPTVLIIAQPTATAVAAMRARRYWVFSAETVLVPKPKGAFRDFKTLHQLIAEQTAGVQDRAPHPPLPLRGKRYEIADDFSSLTKLGKKPVRYPITQPLARALLSALVDSGAGTQLTAIEKARLLHLTYRDKPVPDVRPSQLLRYTTARGGTKPLPFRDDILCHQHGLYWLEH